MILRSTFVHVAQRCVREAYYAYHLGLRTSRGGVNVDIFFGSAVHGAIEIALRESEHKAICYLDSLLWPPSKKKTKPAAVILLRNFLRKFKHEVMDTERLFEYDLGRHTWRGKWDLIAKDRGIVIGEHKTTKPAYLQLKPNTQFIAYYEGAKQEFDSFEKFEVYNLDVESLEVYTHLVNFNQSECDEWREEVQVFADYLDQCFSSGMCPKSDGSCRRYEYRTCQFMDLCTASGSIRDAVMKNCFNFDIQQKELSW